ncbi:hypothetical protein F2P56_015377 [Juglans regia]|uniref:Uncharacterized protein LOC108979357 n=2 Tax=Juglans regia TaxID=51240 RepID=A0A2I4DEJ6_JUGRE|nr:uncharacterized protein LOC108979357 [Juglans regia]KAF5465361.1 hypothetical protein F2P56_015377 [Juglans regia]
MAHEMFHHLKHHKGEKCQMALKLDMEKAFDFIEWNFLFAVMRVLGFNSTWINLIKECISTASFSILINGSPKGFFNAQRGLQQDYNDNENSGIVPLLTWYQSCSTSSLIDPWPRTQVQITAYLRGQDLYCYVDGSLPSPPKFLEPTKPNPEFLTWTRVDQLVLSVLFSSLSDSILGHVLSSSTAQALWLTLNSMFTSHSQAKEFQVRFQLTNLSRGDQSISDYFGKVRSLADTLAAIGSPLHDKEVVTYLLSGLGPTYESFVTSVTTRSDPLTTHELYQLLLIHENRMSHNLKNIFDPSVNYTTSAGRDQRGGRSYFRGGRQGKG